MFKPELIKGTITHLQTLKGRHNFVMSGGAQAATGAAAAGAAVVGSFFSSSLLATSALALNESAVFFTCDVNGIKLSGCFNTLNIAEGEEVELVADFNEDHTEGVVYAIRKPQQRCLWVAPTMEVGHGVAKNNALFFPLIFLKYLLPIAFILGLIFFTLAGSLKQTWEAFPYLLFTALGAGVLAYCVIALGMYVTFAPKAKQATKVIAALGFKDPANTGLGLVDLKAKEQWEKEHGKPFPKEQYDDYALFY
ncbi:MAG: putative type VI secretion system effector [Cellvibrionaceae bacterium]